MSGLADVHAVERVTEDDGTPGVDVTIDPDSGNDADADHFGPPGDDSLPLPGVDLAAVSDGAGSGNPQVTGYFDSKNPGKSVPGEIRRVARATDGTPVSEYWYKLDGSVLITNYKGKIEIEPDGTANVNGARIDTSGNVVTSGEVTAKGVELSKHPHPSAMGPTGLPTPTAAELP